MALAFVARQNGEEAAQQVAGYLEYSGDFRWHSICELQHAVTGVHMPVSRVSTCIEIFRMYDTHGRTAAQSKHSVAEFPGDQWSLQGSERRRF